MSQPPNKVYPEVNPGYAGLDPQKYPPVMNQPVSNTTVIVQPAAAGLRPWNTGLFDCFEDIGICLFGTFCGLCLACQTSKLMGESMCVPCCVPMPLTVLRTKWRTQNNLEGSIMEDCVLNYFCGPCINCQLAREVKLAQEARPSEPVSISGQAVVRY